MGKCVVFECGRQMTAAKKIYLVQHYSLFSKMRQIVLILQVKDSLSCSSLVPLPYPKLTQMNSFLSFSSPSSHLSQDQTADLEKATQTLKNPLSTRRGRGEKKIEFNITGGDILHSPGGSRTIECHADSKYMILSKPASIRPPTEPISPRVLGSHRETFKHPTGCAVNGSPTSAFSLSVCHSPSSSYSFIPLAGDEGES